MDLVTDLANSSTRLEGLAYEDIGVRSAFDLSYRRLSPEVARIFRLIALHPGPHFSTEATAALADDPDVLVRRQLSVLARSHLLEQDLSERWHLHDLIYLYARELADDPAVLEDRDSALKRLLRYYLDAANIADAKLYVASSLGGSNVTLESQEALEWFDSERVNLLSIVGLAESLNSDVALRLPLTMVQYLTWRNQRSDLLTTTITALNALSNAPAQQLEARDLDGLGYALRQAGLLAPAIHSHRKAASRYKHAGDVHGEGRATLNLGIVLVETRQFDEAITVLRRAGELYEAAQDKHGQAIALTNLGDVLRRQRRLQEATLALRQATGLHAAAHDEGGEATALTNLGAALAEAGEPKDAVDVLMRAIELHRDLQDQHGEAAALTNLGSVLRKLHDYESAASVLRRAASLYGETGDRRGQAGALTNLGTAVAKQEQYDIAVSILRQASALYHEAGDRRGRASALTNLGTALAKQEQYDDAVSALLQAADLYRDASDSGREARARDIIASISARRADEQT
jgi:tetratricopeptide (TPR) repeat protein